MCGYNPFYLIDWMLDKEHEEQVRKEAEMLKDIPIIEFKRIVKELPEFELKIILDLSYQWHDEEMISTVKNEYKKRGLRWN